MINTQPRTMAATIRASTKGLDEVDEARRKKGWSKSEKAWADLALTSVATLRRFWAGVAIQTETFQNICAVVGIEDWELIAAFERGNESFYKSHGKRLSFAIAGSIEETDKHKLDVIVALLHKLGGDTSIEILDIDEGSIKLILGGSSEALEKIEALFRAGALTEVSGSSVQDVHFLEKEELIELIKKNGGTALNLRGADLIEAILIRANLREADLIEANLREADLIGANLREADLSRADLSRADLRVADLKRANLREANLREANLSGADLIRADLIGSNLIGSNLIGARFGNNLGLSDSDKQDMQARGAIFQDSPESDVPSVVKR